MSQTDIKQKDPLLTLMKEIKEYARAYSRNPCEAKDHKEPVCSAIQDFVVEQIKLDRQRRGEPVAYAVFSDNGNIRIWCTDPIQAQRLRQEYGDQLRMLYAAPQPADPVVKESLTTEKHKCDGNHGGPRCADPKCWNDTPDEQELTATRGTRM